MIDVDLGWCRYFVTDAPFGSVSVEDQTFNHRIDDIGIRAEQVCWMNQTHSSNVQECKTPEVFDNTDGLISKVSGLLLVTRTADCAPIVMYDAVTKYVGVLHCGRKGFLNGIVRVGIRKMLIAGCKIDNLSFFLGPFLRVEHHEVGEEIVREVPSNIPEVCLIEKQGRYYFDLTRGIKETLYSLGVSRNAIDDCGIDTYTDDEYFSYRRMTRDGDNEAKTNRFASCILLTT
jgi:polyphenol oxidase